MDDDVVVFLLIAVFAFGMLTGLNWDKPFHEKKFKVQANPGEEYYNESKVINYSGTFTFRGVEWNFSKDRREKLTGQVRPDEDQIFIKTGREARKIDTTCVHEIMHVWFPEFRHEEVPEGQFDPIYRISDDIDVMTCNVLVEKAIEKR